jgi:hypothetical protein
MSAVAGQIYTSSNFGANWTIVPAANGAPTTANWYSISLSASGQYQSAVAYGGAIYTSSNFGANWTSVPAANGAPTSRNWTSISLSASGQYMSAVVNSPTNGAIYTSVASMIMSNLYLTGATGQTGGTGNVNNSSNNVYCNNVYALSAVYANNVALTSDYRIKENVKALDNQFQVDYLNPVTYMNKQTKKQDIGLIAHELQEYYPELVTGEKDGSETQTVNYIGLIPILISEIKNLKNTVQKLEFRISELEKI